MSNTIHSWGVRLNPNPSIFNALAPNITGIARKNENSEATPLLVPKRTAPKMVEPEREVPGIRARTWKQPIRSAVLYVSSESPLILGIFF